MGTITFRFGRQKREAALGTLLLSDSHNFQMVRKYLHRNWHSKIFSLLNLAKYDCDLKLRNRSFTSFLAGICNKTFYCQ